MTPLEKIESLVPRLACPVCLNFRFEVNLSCDMPETPCDFPPSAFIADTALW